MSSAGLRWEAHSDNGWWAYSGEIMIGMIVCRRDGTIHWTIDAVHMKWTAKGYGDATSLQAARRSVARSWRIWLKRAGLTQEGDSTNE